MHAARVERLAAARPTSRARSSAGEFAAPLPADRRPRRPAAIVGFEALVRWQHPTRGLVPPADVHPAGRGDRADRAASAAGCSREACRAGGALAGRDRGRTSPWRVNVSAAPARSRRPRRRRSRDALDRGRPRPGRARARDHRVRAGRRHREPRSALQQLREPRRPARDRRLRHRLLVAELPAPVPDRHPEDRPLVRRRRSTDDAERSLVERDPRARPLARPGGGGRGDRDRAQRARAARAGLPSGQGYLFARPLPIDQAEALLRHPDPAIAQV